MSKNHRSALTACVDVPESSEPSCSQRTDSTAQNNNVTDTLTDFSRNSMGVDQASDFEERETGNENMLDIPEDLFISNVAQFFLKLESQCFLPASTMQYIVSELGTVTREGNEVVKENLKKHLLAEKISPEQVDFILNESFSNNPFEKSLSDLRSNYKRKQFYKTKFDYVQPVSVSLKDNNQPSKKDDKCFQYVPIKDTLEAFYRDKSVQETLHFNLEPHKEGILEDFTDGRAYKRNQFFIKNPKGIKIILYQDAFEVVCPIGPAKKKYKLIAVYLSIGNLPAALRSHINNIKLVALCTENDFDHEKVYGKIVEDLKIIEEQGINVGGKMVKGSLLFITGDNLGSHSLGGFVENFSKANYFCRYCMITRKEFIIEKHVCRVSVPRTAKLYNAALEKIKSKSSYEGVKFDSIFNKLENFHVCEAGLPPCLGHDLFEGVVAYDLRLYINSLMGEGWFSLIQLNSRIKSFSYSKEDRADKPCPLSAEGEKISGGAWQVWNFLRLLPLLVEDKIQDSENEVWRLVILLTEIVEIVCAPIIAESCLPYLERIICQYLLERQSLFDVNLRPKHHYLRHYPQLILEFGPLMKVWTLRFESKHTFFKRLVRFTHNFININKSLSEKHELHQSLIRLGADIRFRVQIFEPSDFHVQIYDDQIKLAVKKANLPKVLQECSRVSVQGTQYTKGNALAIRQKGYQHEIVIGKICMFLCDNEQTIFILVEIVASYFWPYLRAYELGRTIQYECLPLSCVVDYKPMHQYNLGNMLCIKPHHAFISNL